MLEKHILELPHPEIYSSLKRGLEICILTSIWLSLVQVDQEKHLENAGLTGKEKNPFDLEQITQPLGALIPPKA